MKHLVATVVNLWHLKRLGIETKVVGYSEIDKYAIQVYEALHGKHKNYGGIGSFDRLPKDIDICTWSFPCFTKRYFGDD